MNLIHYMIRLNKSVESTASAQCTESSRLFEIFQLTCRVTTGIVKISQKTLNIQHLEHSRYGSTDLFGLTESINHYA